MAGFRHISTRLIVWILGSAAVALFAVGTYQQQRTRRIVLQQAEARTAAVAVGVKEELQGILRSIETTVRLSGANLEAGAASAPGDAEGFLQRMLQTNARIYGTAVAYEPFAAPQGVERYAPYFYRRDNQLLSADLNTPAYRYWDHAWYRQPLETGGPVWTEPYFDEGGGNIPMVTYAVPFHRIGREGKKPAGVVMADVSLAWLKRIVESNQISSTGFVIIFSASGQIIAHPDTQLIMHETLDSLAQKYGRPQFATMYREVSAGHSGSIVYQSLDLQVPVHVEYYPVKVGGWGVIVGVDEEVFYAPVRAAGRVALWSSLGALLLLAGVIIYISRRITRPLAELTATAGRIAQGHLEVAISPPRTRDEVGQLTAAFGQMQSDLRTYVANLAAATAARQKLESELAIAQQIQRSMLSAPNHIARGRHTIGLTAQILPAKTVGGDLYVYFPAGPSRLCFAIGDVSDKGVPAALFMARTITLLRTIGRDGAAPDEILRRVNTELCQDNDECMFVTLFCGVLDLETGELIGASAGHEPPLLLRATGGAALWEFPAGPALGLDARIDVPCTRLLLSPGDTLLFYTDGVTDAANPTGQLYGREALLAEFGGGDSAAPGFTAKLLSQIKAFEAGAPQADDITLFLLRVT